MVDTLALLSLTEKISPLELMLVWLFSKVSNQPLPDLCMERIAKYLTGLQEHSSLTHKSTHTPLEPRTKRKLMNTLILPAICLGFRIMNIWNVPWFDVRLRTRPLKHFNVQETSTGNDADLLKTDWANVDSTDHHKGEDDHPQHKWRFFRELEDKTILR